MPCEGHESYISSWCLARGVSLIFPLGALRGACVSLIFPLGALRGARVLYFLLVPCAGRESYISSWCLARGVSLTFPLGALRGV